MMYIHETLETFTSLLGATYENGGGPVGSDSPVVSVKFDRKDGLDKPKCSSSSTKELINFLSSVHSSSSKIDEVECTFPSLSLEMQDEQQGEKNESEGSARTSCRKRKYEIYLAHPVIEAMNSPSSSLSHDSTRLLKQAWNELSPKSELSELLSRDLVFSNDFSDRVASTTRTLLEEAPKDMLQNVVATMERLVDSRMKSYATFLAVKALNSAATNDGNKKNEEQKKLQLSELLKNSCCTSAGGVKKKRKTEQRWVSCDSTTTNVNDDVDDAMELDHDDHTTKDDKVQKGYLGKIVSAASSFALVPSLDPTLTEVSTRKNTNKNSDEVESKVEVADEFQDEVEKNFVEATLPLTFASAMDIVFKNSPNNNNNKRISIGLHAPGKVVGIFQKELKSSNTLNLLSLKVSINTSKLLDCMIDQSRLASVHHLYEMCKPISNVTDALPTEENLKKLSSSSSSSLVMMSRRILQPSSSSCCQSQRRNSLLGNRTSSSSMTVTSGAGGDAAYLRSLSSRRSRRVSMEHIGFVRGLNNVSESTSSTSSSSVVPSCGRRVSLL